MTTDKRPGTSRKQPKGSDYFQKSHPTTGKRKPSPGKRGR